MRHPAVASQRAHLPAKEREQRGERQVDHSVTWPVAPARRAPLQGSLRVQKASAAEASVARQAGKRPVRGVWDKQQLRSVRHHLHYDERSAAGSVAAPGGV
jgi:hypothetical protein